jgi:hypothetical protein
MKAVKEISIQLREGESYNHLKKEYEKNPDINIRVHWNPKRICQRQGCFTQFEVPIGVKQLYCSPGCRKQRRKK